jgi:octaprenyl-diphosphate synthase
MKNSSESALDLIRQSLAEETVAEQTLLYVIDIVRDSGALNYTRQLAEKQAQAALQCLAPVPASIYRDAMESMVEFSVSRSN